MNLKRRKLNVKWQEEGLPKVNAGIDAKEAANAICAEIRAEFVQAIGSKFTIYKKNNENPKIFFPGHEQAKPKDKRESSSKRITKKQATIRSIKKK